MYTDDGKTYFLPDDELPLILPELEDYKGRNGQAPLENATEWKQYNRNGIHGVRETSTMPGSAGSSWYYFRYIDPKNDKVFCDPSLRSTGCPLTCTLAARARRGSPDVFEDLEPLPVRSGAVPVKEPFKKLVHQGMILGENGIKMGKRFPKYVVNPSDIVREYGADTLRLYEMFMGPLEVSKPWSTTGVVGAKKFINRVWNFFTEEKNITDTDDGKLTKIYHQTVKKVTADYEALAFNTAIAQMMVFVNEVYKNGTCPRAYAEGFIKMLSCITPHVGEEIWQPWAMTIPLRTKAGRPIPSRVLKGLPSAPFMVPWPTCSRPSPASRCRLPGGPENLLKMQVLPFVGDVEHLVGVPVLHPLNHGGKVCGGVDGGAVGLDQNDRRGTAFFLSPGSATGMTQALPRGMARPLAFKSATMAGI